MQDLRIYYETEKGKHSINSNFEKDIERIALRNGLKFHGSGVEIETGIRDIHYAKDK